MDVLIIFIIVFLLVEMLCLYPTAMYLWRKYILKHGVAASAKVKSITKTKAVNWRTWNYEKAAKKAPLIYHVTLIYTVKNVKYIKKIHTGILSNNIKICANSSGKLPIKYLRKSPTSVVCTSEVVLKAMNKMGNYAIVVGPILAIIKGLFMAFVCSAVLSIIMSILLFNG